jgi:biopolymer transport protein ExbD
VGEEPRIQLNDAFARVKELQQFVITEREAINEAERPLMTVSIKADEQVKMGLVTDIKQELRKANSLKINYSTRKGEVYED